MKRPAPLVGAGAWAADGAMPDEVSVAGVTWTGEIAPGARVAGGAKVVVGVAVADGTCTDVTFVVPAADAALPPCVTPPVLSSTAGSGTSGTVGGAAVTVLAAGATGADVVSTYAGSRRAWSRLRHDATIIVDNATVAAAPAMIVQTVLLRA